MLLIYFLSKVHVFKININNNVNGKNNNVNVKKKKLRQKIESL